MTTTSSTDTAVDTKDGHGFVKIPGLIVAIIGAIMLIGGAGTWILVQSSLSDERITVSEDASSNAGNGTPRAEPHPSHPAAPRRACTARPKSAPRWSG